MQIKTNLTKQVLAYYWLLNKVLFLVVFFFSFFASEAGVTGAVFLPQAAINSKFFKWSMLHSVSENGAIYSWHCHFLTAQLQAYLSPCSLVFL